MKPGTYTATHSDLYYKVHKVHHVSTDKGYVKARISVFYKSSGMLCRWICPHGPKNFKLIKSVVEHWEVYTK